MKVEKKVYNNLKMYIYKELSVQSVGMLSNARGRVLVWE